MEKINSLVNRNMTFLRLLYLLFKRPIDKSTSSICVVRPLPHMFVMKDLITVIFCAIRMKILEKLNALLRTGVGKSYPQALKKSKVYHFIGLMSTLFFLCSLRVKMCCPSRFNLLFNSIK